MKRGGKGGREKERGEEGGGSRRTKGQRPKGKGRGRERKGGKGGGGGEGEREKRKGRGEKGGVGRKGEKGKGEQGGEGKGRAGEGWGGEECGPALTPPITTLSGAQDPVGAGGAAAGFPPALPPERTRGEPPPPGCRNPRYGLATWGPNSHGAGVPSGNPRARRPVVRKGMGHSSPDPPCNKPVNLRESNGEEYGGGGGVGKGNRGGRRWGGGRGGAKPGRHSHKKSQHGVLAAQNLPKEFRLTDTMGTWVTRHRGPH